MHRHSCFKLGFSHSDLPSAVTLHAAICTILIIIIIIICTIRQLQLDVRHAVGSKGFASRLQIACTARQLQADMRNLMGSKCADKCFCYCSKRASAAQEEDTHKAFCAAAAGQHGSNGPSGPCRLAITYLQPHTWQSIFC